MAQWLKCLPAVQETWVRSLSWEDPLEKEMATHSGILAWRIPWREELLSRLVITFLPRSKGLLILWLPSPSAGILEAPNIKSATVSLSICLEVMRPDTMIFVC